MIPQIGPQPGKEELGVRGCLEGRIERPNENPGDAHFALLEHGGLCICS